MGAVVEAADYYELVIGMTEMYNSLFEFWLTVTFAYLITVHLTFEDIDKRLRKLILLIYGAAAFLFIIRWTLAIQGVYKLSEAIESAGYPPPPFSPEPWHAIAVYSAVFALMSVGTIMSLYFGVIRRDRT